MLAFEALKEVMDKYQIQQQEIVKASGVDGAVVSRFLNGKTDISGRNLQKILHSLPVQATAYFNVLYSYPEIESKKKTFKVAEKANTYKV